MDTNLPTTLMLTGVPYQGFDPLPFLHKLEFHATGARTKSVDKASENIAHLERVRAPEASMKGYPVFGQRES